MKPRIAVKQKGRDPCGLSGNLMMEAKFKVSFNRCDNGALRYLEVRNQKMESSRNESTMMEEERQAEVCTGSV
jgi:hypothetical protein